MSRGAPFHNYRHRPSVLEEQHNTLLHIPLFGSPSARLPAPPPPMSCVHWQRKSQGKGAKGRKLAQQPCPGVADRAAEGAGPWPPGGGSFCVVCGEAGCTRGTFRCFLLAPFHLWDLFFSHPAKLLCPQMFQIAYQNSSNQCVARFKLMLENQFL